VSGEKMRLKSLQIQNFRSIDTFSINLRDFTSLIGPNNSGKSSLLRAIEIFLNQETPELEEWRKNHEKEPIIIEGVFDEIQEWERDTPGISGLVHNNEIRLRCKSNQIETPNGDIKASTPQYEAFTQEITITGWSDKLSEASQDIQDIASSLNFNGTNWRNSANKERARQVIRETRPDLMTIGAERWSSDSISINAALKQALPQAVLIEAVRDASEDAKPAAKTPFGLLMNKLVFPAIQKSDEYKQFIGAVQALDAKIRGNGVEKFETVKKLEQDIHDRMSSIIESKAIVTLDTPDTEKFIGGSAKIKIDDGIETPIHLQGHGVQRSLIFALIEVLAKQDSMVKSNSDAQATPEGATPTDSKQRATILLFEEPELYIHPHLMRRLQQSLQDISKSQNWQVIISTHSPFLVDVATDPLSLVILRREKSSLSPVAIQLESDPFNDEASKHDREALRAALDFHPTVTEAFSNKACT
jgi:putative ATP-dependent endonuclease of OLD family